MFKPAKFLRKIYEKKLENEVVRGNLPDHIMIVTDEKEFLENTGKFFRLIEWCRRFRIEELTLCLRMHEEGVDRVINELDLNIEGYRMKVITKDRTVERGDGDIRLNFILGYGGRAEITDAIREIARSVKEGKLSPSDVDESEIERHLRIKDAPDLIIRAGEEIPDFLIWQSIYSELFFLDIDWRALRYVDFLRCLRGYQMRERRFGR
jgi:undecaprenyl diphosphate synthase